MSCGFCRTSGLPSNHPEDECPMYDLADEYRMRLLVYGEDVDDGRYDD